MVSIVLPVYNGEKYLSEAIESILHQTYCDFELIIVNDASTDKTKEIILEYSKNDERIKIIENKVNMKLPRCLNIGFENARGKYYTWTSDDNRYEKNAIEEMVNILEKDINVDFVYAKYVTIDHNGIRRRIGKVSSIDDIYIYNCIGACFLYKSKIHSLLNGYDTNTFLYEDYDFWLRAYDIGTKFLFIDKILYEYRVHNGSLTNTKRQEVSKKVIPVLKRNLHKSGMLDFELKGKICCHISELYIFQDNEMLVTVYNWLSKLYLNLNQIFMKK